jgi:hypothetical protein
LIAFNSFDDNDLINYKLFNNYIYIFENRTLLMTDIEKQVYKKFNAGIAAEDEALGGLSH